ncbi:uncharacterized protein BX664DRAFT_363232 [Halteromyces radiatus]|uniref:uncharacterized protein n=1 Tax=Halteromyces radiatus TaxID=101107 RepID=UPI002220C2D5|nr:uncharacterized protein BX664DRAFT_363232 [Halteromyces radiatus]KAI8099091.1 hypothetical protein BX664DRAFT_363232 [Halteromyces radiatus]
MLSLLPILFALLMRKRGGFYYRSLVSTTCMGAMTVYGMVASLTLPLIGKAGLVNWSVARLYYHLCGFLLAITTTIEGKEHLDRTKGPAVYVCNHQSSMDILLMASVFPKSTSVVAKKQIKYYPFLGWYMTLSNAIFLDRKNRDSAIKEARQAAEDIHRKKTSVWLFPEGTRGRPLDIDMLPFKKGAFYMAVQAKVPIIPIVISNYQNIYNSKTKRFGHGNVKIKVLPPVSTEHVQEDSAAIDQLANKVRNQMLEVLRDISPRLH